MKYCKKLFALLAAALLCMALTLPAGAAAPLVRDECGVFDADTLADLEEQAESASDGHDVDVYFLVVDDIGDADQRDYAKNYYISNGLGYGDEQSGILFLLAVGSRKYVTITYGEGVTAFTDYRIEQQEDEIDLLLSESNGCHCKGKCSNRKCPCRNFGKECGAQCRCQHDKCSNRVCLFNECVTGRQHRFP